MSGRLTATALLVAAFAAAATPRRAHAQAVPAGCRPLIDAERKQIMTPNHAYVTVTPASPGAETMTSETITARGVMYVMVQGRWMKSPTNPRDLLAQMKQNLATAKHYSCRRTGVETVGGVRAAVYTSHGDNAGVTSDTRSWVATDTGLLLRSEEDVDEGGTAGKTHVSVRYEYTHIRAPDVGR